MFRIAVTGFAVLLLMYLIPFPVYAGFSALGWVSMPAPDAPGAFMLSVLVTKIGVAATFVLLFRWAHQSREATWQTYAIAWLVLFLLSEIGQAIGPGYGWGEAVAGMLSETVYVPLSAWVAARLLSAEGASGQPYPASTQP